MLLSIPFGKTISHMLAILPSHDPSGFFIEFPEGLMRFLSSRWKMFESLNFVQALGVVWQILAASTSPKFNICPFISTSSCVLCLRSHLPGIFYRQKARPVISSTSVSLYSVITVLLSLLSQCLIQLNIFCLVFQLFMGEG